VSRQGNSPFRVFIYPGKAARAYRVRHLLGTIRATVRATARLAAWRAGWRIAGIAFSDTRLRASLKTAWRRFRDGDTERGNGGISYALAGDCRRLRLCGCGAGGQRALQLRCNALAASGGGRNGAWAPLSRCR